MKKWMMLAALVLSMMAFGMVTAQAAEPERVELAENKVDITYDAGAEHAGQQYVMLILKEGTQLQTDGEGLTTESILYIDQAAADTEGKVAFTGLQLKTFTNADVYFGGASLEAPVNTHELRTPGVTVSGEILSCAPEREGVVALYPYVEGAEPDYYDKVASRRPLLDTPYRGTFGGPDGISGSEQGAMRFFIDGVPEGTYLLVVKKPGNTHFVIKNFVVEADGVDLTDTAKYPAEVNLMTLCAGDIDGNGKVEAADAETAFLLANWGLRNPEEALCDLDGNGIVESADVEMIFMPVNWGKGDVILTLKNSKD